jgi:hypothetical protein
MKYAARDEGGGRAVGQVLGRGRGKGLLSLEGGQVAVLLEPLEHLQVGTSSSLGVRFGFPAEL